MWSILVFTNFFPLMHLLQQIYPHSLMMHNHRHGKVVSAWHVLGDFLTNSNFCALLLTILGLTIFFSFDASFIANLSSFIEDAHPQAQQSRFGMACSSRSLDKFKLSRAFIDHSCFDDFFSFDASFIANLSAFIDDAHPSARQSRFGVASPPRFGWQRSMDFA